MGTVVQFPGLRAPAELPVSAARALLAAHGHDTILRIAQFLVATVAEDIAAPIGRKGRSPRGFPARTRAAIEALEAMRTALPPASD